MVRALTDRGQQGWLLLQCMHTLEWPGRAGGVCVYRWEGGAPVSTLLRSANEG